jgi:hypothetical protein
MSPAQCRHRGQYSDSVTTDDEDVVAVGEESGSALTLDDVTGMNNAAVERAAVIARLGGTALTLVGGMFVAAWLWFTVRSQMNRLDRGADLLDRVDLFINYLAFLGSAASIIGLGLGLRVVATYVQARVGGSVTGFQVGDLLPDDDSE